MRWLAVVFVLACSADDSTQADAGDAAVDAAVDAGYPAPHPAPPQVQNQQGPVLATPKVVPIFFPNDAEQPQIEDFLHQLATSGYWAATTAEYGVGALTIASSIVATGAPATIDTAGIESALGAYADGDPNDLFAIFYPTSTTISDPQFGTSCTDFNGFHFQGLTDTKLVYAVLPRCASAGALTGLDALTASLSHELVEAVTDPFLQTSPAWAFPDIDHLIWSFEPGAEVADMCDLEPQSFEPLVGPYFVQRSWSNASAHAGHDPCVPAPTTPYFNAAPVLTAKQSITVQSQSTATNGLALSVGETKTIIVQLFSDAPTSDWTVDAFDITQPPGLTFAWDAQSGNNGTTLHLTVTRTADTSSEIVIESKSGTSTNLWFAYVTEPP